MSASDHVKVTQSQGNVLYLLASGFALPKELGENTKYTPDVQITAAEAVLALRTELRSRSPLITGPKRLMLFGPADNWEPSGEKKDEYILEDPNRLVKISLSENVLEGIFWCLVVSMHPCSQIVLPVGNQQDTLWPLAAACRLTSVLRDELGLTKAKHRRIDLDEDPSEVRTEKKKKK